MKSLKQNFKLFLLLPIVAFLFSCGDDSNPSDSNNNIPTDNLSDNAFTATVSGEMSLDFDVSGLYGTSMFDEDDHDDYTFIEIYGMDMVTYTSTFSISIDLNYYKDKNSYSFTDDAVSISARIQEGSSITRYDIINSGSLTVHRNDDKAFHATFSANLTDEDTGKSIAISDGYFYKKK